MFDVRDLQKKLQRDLILESVADLINAEFDVLLTDRASDTKIAILELLEDEALLGELMLEAMVNIIPDDHKYKDLRQEATVKATAAFNKKKELLFKVLDIN